MKTNQLASQLALLGSKNSTSLVIYGVGMDILQYDCGREGGREGWGGREKISP